MASVDDPQDFAKGMERQRRLLENSEEIDERDREQIERWIVRKDGSVEISSLATYLRRVRVGGERSEVPLVDMDEDDYHRLVYRLRHEYDLADATVQSYENAILLFIGDIVGAGWVDSVERTSVDRAGPNVDEMLTPEDVHQLTTTSRHHRDVAFIEFLADTGSRLSLALSLRVKDVALELPATYRPNRDAIGLKGAPITDYPLIDSTGVIRSYLRNSHPRPDDGDVALFHKIKPAELDDGERWSDDGSVNARSMYQQLRRIASRADLDKPVKPHAFRHAAITRMVREGYSRSQIEHRVHWTLDTAMWETYEHITSTEHNDDIFREAGILDPEDGPDRVRKDCGNCNQPLAPHHEWCPNCGNPAAPGAEGEFREGKGTILEAIVDETNPSARRDLRTLLERIDERPDVARGHDDSS